MNGDRVRSYSGPYFPSFGLNAGQNNSECGQFHAVSVSKLRFQYEANLSELVKFCTQRFTSD